MGPLTWLTSCSRRSSPTRSRLRRQRRLLPSTSPNTGKPSRTLKRLRKGVRSANPTSQNIETLAVSPSPLDRCEKFIEDTTMKTDDGLQFGNGHSNLYQPWMLIFCSMVKRYTSFV